MLVTLTHTHIHSQIFAGEEDVFNELHVVELHGKTQGLRELLELAEQIHRTTQKGCVLWVGHVWHTARNDSSNSLNVSLKGGSATFGKGFNGKQYHAYS